MIQQFHSWLFFQRKQKHSFEKINAINNKSVKTELLPVLKKGETFNLSESQNIVIGLLKNLLILSDEEILYLNEFSRGIYNPSLLFEDCIALKVKDHPMAKWRIFNNKNVNK